MSFESNKRTGLAISIRLSIFYGVFFVVGYLIIFAVADWMIRTAIADKEREIVSERLSEYRVWFLAGQARNLQERFEEQRRRSTELVFVRITGPETRIFLLSSPRNQELIDRKQLDELAEKNQAVVATLVTESPHNVWTVASTPLSGGLLLQVGQISTHAFEAADSFRKIFFFVTMLAALLAIIGGAILSYRAMRPIRNLKTTVDNILETGDLDKRVEASHVRGGLAELGVLFNHLLDRNQGLIQAMRDSLDNVAHDLRTPMARMRVSAEEALAKTGDISAQSEALSDCMEESDRVLIMLDALMDIAEAETGVMSLDRTNVDLVELVHQVTDLYGLVAEDKGVKIDTNLEVDALEVEVDRTRIQQVIANLVDNAIKYSHSGGKVSIDLKRDDSRALIQIKDEGIGISPEDLPRVWERLFRGDASRSERGLGLGLSFVKAIVDAHGGEVKVESESGKGSLFIVGLPLR